MNKEELQSKIENLEKQLAELKEQVNSPEFEGIKKCVRWKPDALESYFYICAAGSIWSNIWKESQIDEYRYATGNCFITKEDAEEYKENLLTKQALKDLALELNNGVEIDWDNKYQVKFNIYFCEAECILYQKGCTTCPNLGQVYCLDENFLNIAEKRIDGIKLVKLIKSGV